MKAMYIKDTHHRQIKFFTQNKKYEVLADYRNRISRQFIDDNGLVITDDLGTQRMIFLNDGFIISDNEIGKTFVFNCNE